MPSTAAALSAQDATRIVEFARACKAAARAVVLYPDGHPAIAATVGRIAELTSSSALRAALPLTVVPEGLLLNGRAPARPDAAIGELAALLHSHLIGQLTVHPGGDVDAWKRFLNLLGRSPESVRAEGGIARLWATLDGRHVEVREIDYAEALRERIEGDPMAWDTLVACCLFGDSLDLNDPVIRKLLDAAARLDDLNELIARVAAAAENETIPAQTAALLRLLRGILDAISQSDANRIEPVLRNMARAVGQLSPEIVAELLMPAARTDSASAAGAGGGEDPQLVNAIVSRMTDATLANFVSHHVAAGTPTDRLATAFQALVPNLDDQQRLLVLAREDVAASPLGATEGFAAMWDRIAERLLHSYSDEPFVSADYGRELSTARDRAVELEATLDDPPERISGWVDSVATTALRALDLMLITDLLRIEDDDERWAALMIPVVRLIEDLLLVGDFEGAAPVLEQLVGEAGADGRIARRAPAAAAIDSLVRGQAIRHITTHLASADRLQCEAIRNVCVSLGEATVQPLVDALSAEDRAATRERLTAILVAFGPASRRIVEQLRNSPDAALRRTAMFVIRQFGGSEALPEIAELLDEREPQVQRDALRAVLNVGTTAAFRLFEQALTAAPPAARDRLMQSLIGARDDRATPLLAHLLRHIAHGGPMAPLVMRSIEALGALRDPAGIAPLSEVLQRGDWWAPRRTAAFRAAAAAALARIGTVEAWAALEDAAARGSRGVRTAARAHLADRRNRHGEWREGRA